MIKQFSCACPEDHKSLPVVDGPVVNNSNSIIRSCLVCGQDYQSITNSILYIEYIQTLFDRMVRNVRNGFDSHMSSAVAQKSLNAIIQLIYLKNCELLAQIRELLKIFVKLDRFSDAVKYCKYLLPSIHSSEGFGRHAFSD